MTPLVKVRSRRIDKSCILGTPVGNFFFSLLFFWCVIVVINAGRIQVADELAVAVSGPGSFHQYGGTTIVGGRLVVGRYNKAEAIGTMELVEGTIKASRIDINEYSKIEFKGGELFLDNDVRSRVENFIAEGKITPSDRRLLEVTYDANENLPRIARSLNWDVAGILGLDAAGLGPTLPDIVRGEGERIFVPAPEYGVHPRVLFGPEEIPSLRNKLLDANNKVAEAALLQVKLMLTLITP